MQHSGKTISSTPFFAACSTNDSIFAKFAFLSPALLSICTAATRIVRSAATGSLWLVMGNSDGLAPSCERGHSWPDLTHLTHLIPLSDFTITQCGTVTSTNRFPTFAYPYFS